MMVMILSVILFVVFTALGGLHFYWLFGGYWGLKQAVPTNDNGTQVLRTPKFATLLVGLVLSSFGMLYLIRSGLITVQVPNWVATYGYWFVPTIFILRALGEFNYVGFFKRVKNTEFARADSRIFSPLCLGIGVIGILIQLMH